MEPIDDVGDASRLFVVKLSGSLLNSSSSSSSVVSEGVGGGGGCRTEPGEVLGGISGGGVALIGVGATNIGWDGFLLLVLLLLLLLLLFTLELREAQPMISEIK
jgi:hypothetical protein